MNQLDTLRRRKQVLGLFTATLLLMIVMIVFLSPGNYILIGLLACTLLSLLWILVALSRGEERERANLIRSVLADQKGWGYDKVEPTFYLPNMITGKARLEKLEAEAAVGGIAVTLDSVLKEPTPVISRAFPFPKISENTEQTLIAAVMNATGKRIGVAENISRVITIQIAEVLKDEWKQGKSAVMMFPLGRYENLDSDRPIFIPQSITITWFFPEAHSRILARYYKHAGREK